MAFDLKNKRILITGSSDGLGRLLAIELSKAGANITVHGRSEEKVKKVLAELEGNNNNFIICDLNEPGIVEESFKTIDQLDILINNAGLWAEGNTIDISSERIMKLVNVNLASYLLTVRTLLPVLKQTNFGQILNVVSVAGIEIPFNYYHTIYSATKFGLQGFSEALAKEFDDKNIRVMGFYPGGMETELFVKAGEDYKEHESWMFDPMESVEAIIFMLTRNPKVNVKRMDLINHLQQ